jgi:hypothetical protein
MRKITQLITTCYYSSCKHSHSALAHNTLLKMLDVFIPRVVTEPSVAPINSSTASHASPFSPSGDHLVDCDLNVVFRGLYFIWLEFNLFSQGKKKFWIPTYLRIRQLSSITYRNVYLLNVLPLFQQIICGNITHTSCTRFVSETRSNLTMEVERIWRSRDRASW